MNSFIYLIILCLWHSILFYDNSLGINVFLYTIPLIIYLFYVLKINRLIKNKSGLLFLVPIVTLSITYFIYDNVFKYLNMIIIPILYVLMFIYTSKSVTDFIDLFRRIVFVLFKPFDCVDRFYKIVSDNISKLFKIGNEGKKKIKSIVIVVPIVLLILILLSSADRMFSNIFSGIFDLLDYLSFNSIVGRAFLFVIVFTYMGSFLYYIIYKYNKNEDDYLKNKDISVDEYTVKLLLTILNVIYVVFDIIQIRSLLFHKVSSDIVYSHYAREGFFQLMFISILNLLIILISKKSKENKYNQNMSLLMIGLTFIIILSSFYRMYLYESNYGYTTLRLLVYITLITEVILLIPTIKYILNSKFKIVKYYLIIIITVYTLINTVSLDYVIAYNNINRFYKNKKIDLEYLENYQYDNVHLLKNFYNKVKDKEIKEDLKYYFSDLKSSYEKTNIFEFNLSKSIGYSKVK